MVLVLKRGATKQEMKDLQKQLDQLPIQKKMEVRKFSGVLQLKEDPLAIQKKMRDEWEQAGA